VVQNARVEAGMKLLKDRKIAIILTVLIAVLATMLGVYKTSASNTRDIEAMFYDGVYIEDGSYTQPGINTHIGNVADAALGLATLLSYPEFKTEAEALLSARRDYNASRRISDKNAAYKEMGDLITRLCNAAQNAGLTERDMIAVAQYYSTYTGAAAAIKNSQYNTEVWKYLDKRSALMRTIGLFVPTREPEYFIVT